VDSCPSFMQNVTLKLYCIFGVIVDDDYDDDFNDDYLLKMTKSYIQNDDDIHDECMYKR
jgi:hypothetical protein